jgi:protocatechuate 3,4-dioxygenase beta subunit
MLKGIVKSTKDCAPIPGAKIEFWQVNLNGQYDDDHRATMYSEASGVYSFESNFPPAYESRPPHIHIRVSAQGYQTLITQYYPTVGETEGTFDLVLMPDAR